MADPCRACPLLREALLLDRPDCGLASFAILDSLLLTGFQRRGILAKQDLNHFLADRAALRAEADRPSSNVRVSRDRCHVE